MNNNQKIFRAMDILGSYLHALGGSAIPLGRGLKQTEIPLYIATKLFEINDERFNAEEYIKYDFTRIAAYALSDTNKYLEMITLSGEELIPFLREFYEYCESKLKKEDITHEWIIFGEYLNNKLHDFG